MKKPDIPYGLDKEGIFFDPNTGDLNPGERGRGLTCASFILAVLQPFGLFVLKEAEWPYHANDEWQQWVVDMLKKTGAPADQIKAVERDVGSRRFAPEEVVASSTDSPWPIGYDRARELSKKLLDQLPAS